MRKSNSTKSCGVSAYEVFQKEMETQIDDGIRLYLKSIGSIPLLAEGEEVELAKKIRKRITLSFLDLIQEGTIGLMK